MHKRFFDLPNTFASSFQQEAGVSLQCSSMWRHSALDPGGSVWRRMSADRLIGAVSPGAPVPCRKCNGRPIDRRAYSLYKQHPHT